MKTLSNFTNVFAHIFPLIVTSIMSFTNESSFKNKTKLEFKSSKIQVLV